MRGLPDARKAVRTDGLRENSQFSGYNKNNIPANRFLQPRVRESERATDVTRTKQYRVSNVVDALSQDIERLAVALLGNPTSKATHEWRWGSRGSMALVIHGSKRGSFYNHERGEGGDALDLVLHVNGGTLVDALRWATDWLGLARASRTVHQAAPWVAAKSERSVRDDAERISRALTIWDGTVPLFGTPAETYLHHRGIAAPDDVADLRFHPDCPAGEGRLPAMVALMRDVQSNEPRAIHRTFLKPDGMGKDDAGKRMLGVARGAVIKLCRDAEVTQGLGLAEGIENALTICAYGWWPVWAAPDVGHVKAFPVLEGIEALTIFADNKKPKDIEAARACAIRWQAAGRSVEIHKPPAGADWNDIARRVEG